MVIAMLPLVLPSEKTLPSLKWGVLVSTQKVVIMEEESVLPLEHLSINILKDSLVNVKWTNYLQIKLVLHKHLWTLVQAILLLLLADSVVVWVLFITKLLSITIHFALQVKWEVQVIFIKVLVAVVLTILQF